MDVAIVGSWYALVTVHPTNARFQNFYCHVFQLMEKCTQSERKSCFSATLIWICCPELGLLLDQFIIFWIFVANSDWLTQYLLLQESQLQRKHCWMLRIFRLFHFVERPHEDKFTFLFEEFKTFMKISWRSPIHWRWFEPIDRVERLHNWCMFTAGAWSDLPVYLNACSVHLEDAVSTRLIPLLTPCQEIDPRSKCYLEVDILIDPKLAEQKATKWKKGMNAHIWVVTLDILRQ